MGLPCRFRFSLPLPGKIFLREVVGVQVAKKLLACRKKKEYKKYPNLNLSLVQPHNGTVNLSSRGV